MNRKIITLILLSFALHLRGNAAEWLTDLPTALSRAKAENKSVLINFTGSDWCGWCIRLKAEVFDKPEFAAYAQQNLVLVELDFPNKPQPKQLRAANDALAKKFRVTGYPTIFIVDADGKQVARGSYIAGGPVKFIEWMANVLEVKPRQITGVEEHAKSAKAYVPDYGQPSPPVHYSELTLKAITGTKKRRFVLVNNQTLGLGEKEKVRLGNGEVVVLCKEIRDDSVVIQVEGETSPRELKLVSQ